MAAETRWRVCSFGLLLVLSGCIREGGSPPRPADAVNAATAPISPDVTQLVTVVTENWNAFRGILRRYERSQGGPWVAVGDPMPVVIGREGYGWGRGVHGNGAPQGCPGPSKEEGDGRSPAGVFEIGDAFGYDPEIGGMRLPYTQATRALRCVDDPQSRHYNRIVSTRLVEPDWRSAEYMRRRDELYAITIVVKHNTEATKPGAGSCIFLHLWVDADTGMSGCTAMSRTALETLARWLRPNSALLVALPAPEYQALRPPWSLP